MRGRTTLLQPVLYAPAQSTLCGIACSHPHMYLPQGPDGESREQLTAFVAARFVRQLALKAHRARTSPPSVGTSIARPRLLAGAFAADTGCAPLSTSFSVAATVPAGSSPPKSLAASVYTDITLLMLLALSARQERRLSVW